MSRCRVPLSAGISSPMRMRASRSFGQRMVAILPHACRAQPGRSVLGWLLWPCHAAT